MVRIRKLSGPRKLLVLAVLSFSTTIVLLRISRMHASRDRCAETLTLTSAHTLRSAIINKCALPLLTLFSTWSDKGNTELTRKLTLRNWQQLKPYVVPVLFSNSVTLRAQAEQWGWFSMPVSNSPIGVPVLKHMYRDAMERFNTTLYAYANGDILFTDSLVDTLLAVLTSPALPSDSQALPSDSQALPSVSQALPSDSQALPSDSQALLVIGRRTNVNFVTDEESATLQNVSRVGRRGKLFIPDSQDYFITNRKFPWQSIPEFVVGRIAYDSWLTATSVTSNDITVVDATKTLLAIHQTVKAGNWAGFYHSNKHYNWQKVEKKKFQRLIRKHLHQTTCASWKTVKATRQENITVTKQSHHEIKKANCLF